MPEMTGAAGAAPEAGQSSSGAPAGAEAAAAGTAAPDAATGAAAGGTEAQPLTPEEAAKLRNESAALRRQLAAFQKAEEQRKQAEMSEAEKLAAEKKRVEEEKAALAKERQAFALRRVTMDAAGRAGAIYPDVIDSMVLTRISEVTFNEAGEPTNVDALIGDIRKSHPHLFRAPAGSADGGAGGTAGARPGAGGSMNDYIRQAAGRK